MECSLSKCNIIPLFALVSTQNGVKDTATIEVQTIPDATSVNITAPARLLIGDTAEISANVLPMLAVQTLSWEIAEGNAYAELIVEGTRVRLAGKTAGPVTVKAASTTPGVFGTATISIVPYLTEYSEDFNNATAVAGTLQSLNGVTVNATDFASGTAMGYDQGALRFAVNAVNALRMGAFNLETPVQYSNKLLLDFDWNVPVISGNNEVAVAFHNRAGEEIITLYWCDNNTDKELRAMSGLANTANDLLNNNDRLAGWKDMSSTYVKSFAMPNGGALHVSAVFSESAADTSITFTLTGADVNTTFSVPVPPTISEKNVAQLLVRYAKNGSASFSTTLDNIVVKTGYVSVTLNPGIGHFADGSSAPRRVFATPGATLGALPEVLHDTAGCTGWAYSNGTAYSAADIFNADTALYAQWSTKQYKVYFVSNDTIIDSTTVAHGQTIAAHADPAPYSPCYTFAGWDKTFPLRITATTTVTAQWTFNEAVCKIYHNVLFVNYDGTPLDTQRVEQGVTPTAALYQGITPERPTTAQYTYAFSGWAPDFAPVTAPVTYTAQFTETLRSYSVTFVSNGAELSELAQSVAYGAAATRPADPALDGHAFDGWFSDTTFATAYNFASTITGNLTLYAKWTSLLLNVREVQVTPRVATVERGATKTFTAFVNGDEGVDKSVAWTLSGNLSDSTTISDGLLTVAAGETATTILVTATSVADGTKSATATVTVPAPPVTGIGTSPLALHVYPTITTGTLTILNGDAGCSVEVYALTGALLKVPATTGTVDLSALPAGTYLVKVGRRVAKVLKK